MRFTKKEWTYIDFAAVLNRSAVPKIGTSNSLHPTLESFKFFEDFR